MYASFFGLRELPFNNTPDPRFFFSTPDHEEALASLIYAIAEGKGFVLLTGEVGSGKTLVTRLMLRHFNDSIAFASINNTQVTGNELLQCVCAEFNIEAAPSATNMELTRRLQDFLLACFADNKPVVLMLDEAQALSREAFEQVRMIGNLEADDAKLLQIVIVGQPELRARFEANDMRQLRQRIFRSFHLSALTREQTEGYIRHRLSVAGVQFPERTLSSSAIDVVHEYSQGLPRLINTLCDNAMLSAYAADQLSIDAPFIRHVIEQMMSVTPSGSEQPATSNPLTGVPQNTGGHAAAPAPTPLSIEDHERASSVNFNQFTDNANRVYTDCSDRMQREARDIHRACRSQLSNESRDVLEVREKLSQTVRQAQEMETDLRALVERTKLAEAHAGPNLEQLQKLTILVRRLLSETRAATDEAREVIAAARTAKTDTTNAVAQLAEQSSRTGRLTVTLREVFDKLETRAEGLANSLREQQAPERPPLAEKSKRILERTRNLDRAIHNSKTSADEIRSLIAATSIARVNTLRKDKRPAERSHGSAEGKSPAAELASQVNALVKLIDDTRALSHA